MHRLTENILQQTIRSCPADLSLITQLNVTGRGLSDVSLIRKLTGLEIVSLSVNNISSLASFESCKNLRILLLRQNNVKDVTEIKYLVHLTKLETFSLAQNPCADEPLYRYTVIKHLQHLLELDDVPVAEEDRKQAQALGKNLSVNSSSSSHVTFTSHENPRSRRLHSKSSQRLKVASTIVIPERKVCFEKVRKNDSGEDTSSADERPSVSRLGARLVPAKSLSRMARSQVRILQGSKIDLSSSSSQGLSIIEEPVEQSNLLMAGLYLIKGLGYGELKKLHAEVVLLLNQYEQNF